jgi:hypothetical protein
MCNSVGLQFSCNIKSIPCLRAHDHPHECLKLLVGPKSDRGEGSVGMILHNDQEGLTADTELQATDLK